MPYTRVNWQNEPSTATPKSAENFNVMDVGIDDAWNFIDKFDANQGLPVTAKYVLVADGTEYVARALLSTDVPNMVRESVTGTTYTMVAADAGKLKHFTNAAAVTVTFPAGLSTPADAVFYFRQYGVGVVGHVASGGASVNSRGATLHSAGQYAEWQATRVGTTDEYILSGDLVV
jgi:hypothetical protein